MTSKLTYDAYYELLSQTAEGDADKLYWMLCAAQSEKLIEIFRTKPKWYERTKRRAESNFYAVMSVSSHADKPVDAFTDVQRNAYYVERNRRQYPDEDAGGYRVRCLNALLTGTVSPIGETYDQLVRRLMNDQ